MQHIVPAARRILVVCLGNHCRSPIAAAVLARRGGSAVDVRSAGLVGHHAGRPAHALMVAAAGDLGYDLTGHRGVQVTPDLLGWAELVLAMDQAVAEQLQHQAGATAQPETRLYLSGADVPDPWGKTAAEFASCAVLIDAGAAEHFSSPPSPANATPPDR